MLYLFLHIEQNIYRSIFSTSPKSEKVREKDKRYIDIIGYKGQVIG